jgi:hypothetical protein
MRRRDFITLLGGAVAWPVAARAQQPILPVIGMINAGTRETAAYRVAAFQQGLRDLGYVEGRDVTIEYRWAEGRYATMLDDRRPAASSARRYRHPWQYGRRACSKGGDIICPDRVLCRRGSGPTWFGGKPGPDRRQRNRG